MVVEVKEVTSPKQLRRFIKYPPALYADDACFVPHLLQERKQFFSDKNPIFGFTRVRYFLALDEAGKVAGRISAHINSRHNEFAGENTGFFGFFESVDQLDVARALFAAAEDRLRQEGMATIRGPFNFSTNDECGFLAWGFDKPPAIMTPYTKPYYLQFMSELGYTRAKDLLAYEYRCSEEIPEHLVRFSRRVQARSRVVIRPLRKENFQEDVKRAFSVYNRAWEDNWGFIPMTEDQFEYMADILKPIVDPAVALIAEIDGEPVGFSLGLPDYNPLFKKMKGRLLPFGIFLLLLGRRKIHRLRVITLGVVRQHRKKGIDVLLIYHTFKNGMPRGYNWGEFSWVLEDNALLRRALERMGAVHYKTYRIFEKRL